MRDESAKHADEPHADGDNPWEDERPRLSDIVADFNITDDRSVQYTDWAERMRTKRDKARASDEPAFSYWTTDALYEESRRVEDEELTVRPNPWKVKELFSLLDLRDDASPEEVGKAYHRMAKQHHPDRYVSADAETQEFHADKMRAIITAYKALKELQRA